MEDIKELLKDPANQIQFDKFKEFLKKHPSLRLWSCNGKDECRWWKFIETTPEEMLIEKLQGLDALEMNCPLCKSPAIATKIGTRDYWLQTYPSLFHKA